MDILRLIWAVDHGLQVRSKQMAKRLGVTGPQRLALKFLGDGLASEPAELAAGLFLHRSTVTGVVARLEAAGMVKRERVGSDHRRHHLTVTAKGRQACRPTAASVESAVGRALGSLTGRQVAAGRVLLNALATALLESPVDWRAATATRVTRP